MLQAFLDDAWSRATNEANSLRATLVTDRTSILNLVRQGAISSVGKNSASQSYKGYGPGGITQVQIIEAIGNLIALYDQLQSKITDEFTHSAEWGNAVPAGFDFDDPIYSLLTQTLSAQAASPAVMVPDISRIRVPFVPSSCP